MTFVLFLRSWCLKAPPKDLISTSKKNNLKSFDLKKALEYTIQKKDFYYSMLGQSVRKEQIQRDKMMNVNQSNLFARKVFKKLKERANYTKNIY